MSKQKVLVAPNGLRIKGTAESMLCTYEIDVIGKHPDGTIDFEYTGEFQDCYESSEQRVDRKKRRLFTDTEGNDWPEDQLKIVEVDEEVET